MTDDTTPTRPGMSANAAALAARKTARRETFRLLLRRPEFVIGNGIVFLWVACADRRAGPGTAGPVGVEPD